MKKLILAVLIAVVVLSASCVYADDSEKMTFDNVTFGKAYKIKGYASVTLLGFKFVNMYAQWEDGKASSRIDRDYQRSYSYVYSENKEYLYHYVYCNWIVSGQEAEFAWLKADIINLQKAKTNFMKDIAVKVIYDDEYEYNGWVRQFNYDYSNKEITTKGETSIGWPVCLSPVDEMSIAPMYKGHYAFGCTLPNFVVEDKDSPLRMEITIGEHKLTYNIR